MYGDIHTGIGSAILTIAAIVITIGKRIRGRKDLRRKHRI